MRVLALALALGAASSAWAQSAEQLVQRPYPGPPAWREVTNEDFGGRGWLREAIPVDQTPDAYSDLLSARALPLKAGLGPTDFLTGMMRAVASACDDVRVIGPTPRTEGGHFAAYGQVYCGREKGEAFGVNKLFKVVQGDTAMYVINRDLRLPVAAGGAVLGKDQAAALQARIDVADRYLIEGVYLCGGASTDSRCGSAK